MAVEEGLEVAEEPSSSMISPSSRSSVMVDFGVSFRFSNGVRE